MYKSGDQMRFKVNIRRGDGFRVKPEAEQLDGNIYNFLYGWVQGDDEKESGQIAWLPKDNNYPDDAPGWLAGADLIEENQNE